MGIKLNCLLQSAASPQRFIEQGVDRFLPCYQVFYTI